MKKFRLLIRLIPTTCLIMLLLPLVAPSNERLAIQPKKDIAMQQTVGVIEKSQYLDIYHTQDLSTPTTVTHQDGLQSKHTYANNTVQTGNYQQVDALKPNVINTTVANATTPTVPQKKLQYDAVSSEISHFVGEKLLSNIQYMEDTVGNGEFKIVDSTRDIYIIWEPTYESESDVVCNYRDDKDGSLYLIARNPGKTSGHYKVCRRRDMEVLFISEEINFIVSPLIRNFDTKKDIFFVNQMSKLTLGDIYVGGVIAYPTITKVTSSNPAVLSVVNSNALSGSTFTLKGENPGKATINISYKVNDGAKVLSFSKSVDIECTDAIYDVHWTDSGSDNSKLLPTQSTKRTFSMFKVYYDYKNQRKTEYGIDLSDYTIEAKRQYEKRVCGKIEVVGNSVEYTAETAGWDSFSFIFKKDGKTVCVDYLTYEIENEQNILEYNGPTRLYYGETVEGPALYHYVYDEATATIQKSKISDAVITCDPTKSITYKDNMLIAGNTTNRGTVDFRCTYDNKSYRAYPYIYVIERGFLMLEDAYENDEVVIYADPCPLIDKEHTLTWSIKKANSSTPPQAKLVDNKDGSSTIKCGGTETLSIQIVYKKGSDTLWTVKKDIKVKSTLKQLIESTYEYRFICRNERDCIAAEDVRINNDFYDTKITGVTSGAPSIVEVTSYTKEIISGRNRFSINIKGLKDGIATVTINYSYKDKTGELQSGSQPVQVLVYSEDNSLNMDKTNKEGVPGESIPLIPTFIRGRYDVDGVFSEREESLSGVSYKISETTPNVASIKNGILTINKNATIGAKAIVNVDVTIDGILYEYATSITITVVSDYYKIQGIPEGTIYIIAGNKKTMTPKLYRIDKDHLSGQLVENPKFMWKQSKSGPLQANLTNEYFTITGMSLEGIKAGEGNVLIGYSYKDGKGNTKEITKDIKIRVAPANIPVLKTGQTGTVVNPYGYFKFIPQTTGSYKLTCSEDYPFPLIEILDQDWNLINSYIMSDYNKAIQPSVTITLKAGKTYWIRGTSSEKTGWSIYNVNFYHFSINSGFAPKNIKACQITLSSDKYVYNGKPQKAAITIKDGKKVLKEGTDYSVTTLGSITNAGYYTMNITGLGNYSGTSKKLVTIQKSQLTADMVQLSMVQVIANGNEQKPTVTVKNGNDTLRPKIDYTVNYVGDFISSGSHTVKITAAENGNYSGAISKTFDIGTILDIKKCTVELSKARVTYSGKEQKPTITVKNGTTILAAGTNYTVEYPKGFINAGNYTITIKGNNRYNGEAKTVFTIQPYDLSGCTVQLSKSSVTYNTKKQTPTVTVKHGTTPLKISTQYKLSCNGTLINPGTYTFTVTGTGNYTGKKTVTYTIKKITKTLAFTKKAITKKYGDKAFTVPLSSSSVKPTSYASSNTKVAKINSTGKVTIVGAGKATITAAYAGTSIYSSAKAYYTLTVSKINNSITASNVTKTTSTKAQTFTLKVSTKGKAALSYSSSSKSVSVKSGKVTIAKNFVGKATITIKAAANTNYNAASKSITITVNPAGTKISSLKKKSGNKFLLKWSKNSKVSGYEIQYATKKSFSNTTKKAISKYSTTSFTASKLKKKTTYYVRVRTYKKVGKVKYYSPWSSVAKVKN